MSDLIQLEIPVLMENAEKFAGELPAAIGKIVHRVGFDSKGIVLCIVETQKKYRQDVIDLGFRWMLSSDEARLLFEGIKTLGKLS